ncbi:MAG: NAD(+)/NADH kinase [Christensenellales bacterium]|jgi:NAD+ kinase
MRFQSVGIWRNKTKPDVDAVTARLISLLEAHGATWHFEDDLASHDISLLFVLGGDGTILSGLKVALEKDVPLLGINMGRLGFLSEIDVQHLREDIDLLYAGRFSEERRMLIRTRSGDTTAYALNDVSLARSDAVLSVEAFAGGASVLRFMGDGLVVATPTGSTAYSLSAGGPIIYPGCDCIVLTPVCAHTLYARPVVLPADETVVVKAVGGAKGARVLLDGRRFLDMEEDGDSITVEKAQRAARFIRLHDRNYFDLLRSKLSDWTH